MLHDKFLMLGHKQTELLEALDNLFKFWALQEGGVQFTPPMLLPVKQLNALDVLINFPHETVLASSINLNSWKLGAAVSNKVPHNLLNDAQYAFPKAACYASYLHYQNTCLTVPGLIITLRAQCCRNETRYHPHSRFMGFHMREIIFIGTKKFVLDYLNFFQNKLIEFCKKLNLIINNKIATDSFYHTQEARKLMQKITATKIEFCHNDIALASRNFHHNFFGERCNINDSKNNPIFSGCLAFGLERWLFVLFHHFKQWDLILEKIPSIQLTDQLL